MAKLADDLVWMRRNNGKRFLKIVFRKVRPRWGERERSQLCGPTLPLAPQVPPVSRREPRFLVICSEAPRGVFPTCCSAPNRCGGYGRRWSEEPCCRWGWWGACHLPSRLPGPLIRSPAAGTPEGGPCQEAFQQQPSSYPAQGLSRRLYRLFTCRQGGSGRMPEVIMRSASATSPGGWAEGTRRHLIPSS